MQNQTNFARTLPLDMQTKAKLVVKDEYVFDFLELDENHSERQLEKGLVRNIEEFLTEIGDMYAFIRSQYRIEIDDKEYFIDILLYHRKLRCLIAIELKIGEFIPEYIGKMQFYLSILDDRVKLKDEKPSIGIILCRSKNKTIVEYALKDSIKPIGVASYQIMSSPPKELEDHLPKPEQISKLLEGLPVSIETSSQNEKKLFLELPPNQKKICLYVKKNGRISNQECQTICKIQKRQVSNELRSLVSKNILKKVGNRGRGTYYTLNIDLPL
ncbi:PDDEXK nuclease domain-containing protein [Candidatus Uabimicrobium sp. HlEnr_7]|uniref:PDDEXK nuclease domain-containing protein n=1 Tax=Candidatus Uabimicrobium helgolandensis TaxID=3095367 RepID=UPI003557DB64